MSENVVLFTLSFFQKDECYFLVIFCAVFHLFHRRITTTLLYGTGDLVNDGQNDDYQQHHADDSHNDHHLHVGPPLLPLQLPGSLLELARPMLQRIRPTVQLRQLLVPLQNLLHVDAHDADDLVDLGLRLLQLVIGRRLLLVAVLAASGRLDAIGTFWCGHFGNLVDVIGTATRRLNATGYCGIDGFYAPKH